MREKNREERESEGPGDGAPRPSRRQSGGGGGEGPRRSRTAPGAHGRGGLVARPDRPAPERSENLTCPEDRPSEGLRSVGSSVRSRGTRAQLPTPRACGAALPGSCKGRGQRGGFQQWGRPPPRTLGGGGRGERGVRAGGPARPPCAPPGLLRLRSRASPAVARAPCIFRLLDFSRRAMQGPRFVFPSPSGLRCDGHIQWAGHWPLQGAAAPPGPRPACPRGSQGPAARCGAALLPGPVTPSLTSPSHLGSGDLRAGSERVAGSPGPLPLSPEHPGVLVPRGVLSHPGP